MSECGTVCRCGRCSHFVVPASTTVPASVAVPQIQHPLINETWQKTQWSEEQLRRIVREELAKLPAPNLNGEGM